MNMKKIIACALAFCFIGGTLSYNTTKLSNKVFIASAEEYTEEKYENLTYKKYSDHIEISRCHYSATEVIIPAEIDGLSVTVIEDEAFHSCEDINLLIIPDSVTTIGKGTFIYCMSLESIKIPEGVTSIGEDFFYSCDNLKSVTLPDSITSIGEYAFYECVSLESIKIPENVEEIGKEAFYKCLSLKSITIPENVKSIGSDAFFFCDSLESITIKNPECKIYDSKYAISDTATIYGYEGSTAQTYAEKYNRKFEVLTKENEEKTDFPSPMRELYTGDIDGDDLVSASDASLLLMEYSALSTETTSFFNEYQKVSGDVNNDGLIDAVDASYILAFYSYLSTGGEEKDMKIWIETQE